MLMVPSERLAVFWESAYLMENIFAFTFNVLATTIGVALAFLLSKWNESRQEAREAENLKNKIKAELEAIYESICIIHKDRDMLLLAPIKMPVYHGAVNSLKIVLLSKYDWYEDLLRLYETLETYNAWHELKTNKTLDNDFENRLPKIKNMLLAIEKELLDRCSLVEESDCVILSEEDMISGLLDVDYCADENLDCEPLKTEAMGMIGTMISMLN